MCQPPSRSPERSPRRIAPRPSAERGQASLLLLGLVAALLAGLLVLFALGQALGAKGRHQRAADLAAVSAAGAMRDAFPRLFEPAFLEEGVPNPRHLSHDEYLALARETAVRVARRNGVRLRPSDVSFPGAGFAPTRVSVVARGAAVVRVAAERRRDRVAVRASATAELAPSADAGLDAPTHGSGGGYEGPLAYRMGKPTPHLFSAL